MYNINPLSLVILTSVFSCQSSSLNIWEEYESMLRKRKTDWGSNFLVGTSINLALHHVIKESWHFFLVRLFHYLDLGCHYSSELELVGCKQAAAYRRLWFHNVHRLYRVTVVITFLADRLFPGYNVLHLTF